MRSRFARTAALLFLVHGMGNGQTDDTSHIAPWRLTVVGGVTVATIVAVHLYQQHAWWEGPRAPFRFENDWDYALNIDKFGHMYGAYLLSHLFSSALSWSGVRDRASVFYGSLFGLGYQLYVEVEDGLHKNYGFSPGDAMSDVAGAMLPVAQETFPVLRNFALKWSYFPSTEYRNSLQHGVSRVFIDDYQGQIYWVAIDPHWMMSEPLSRLVPQWLGFSVGAAARDLEDRAQRRLVLYLSVDYNLSKIVTGSNFLHSLFAFVDHIHLPAPAIYRDGTHWKAGLVF